MSNSPDLDRCFLPSNEPACRPINFKRHLQRMGARGLHRFHVVITRHRIVAKVARRSGAETNRSLKASSEWLLRPR